MIVMLAVISALSYNGADIAENAIKPAGCPIERAHYTSSEGGSSNSELYFSKIDKKTTFASDLALGIKSEPGKKPYWFLYDRGSARYINLISTTDVKMPSWVPPSPDGGTRPLGEMHYIAIDKNLQQIQSIPTSKSNAPELIVLPDVQEIFYYKTADHANVASVVFKFSYCGKN